MIQDRAGIDSLSLILTPQCNLRCRYCFQANKRGEPMSREVLRFALDRILRSNEEMLTIFFTGGEPLLEFGLVRDAISYLEEWLPRGKRLRLAMSTNGMLLTPRVVSFLSSHDVEVQLSFDGVPRAQQQRGGSTFSVLDRRLRAIRRAEPHFYREKLSIAMTVTPATIGAMAESVGYFLGMGIRRIDLGPLMTEVPGIHRSPPWAAVADQLNREFERIHRMSVDHLDRTGEVPLALFRGKEARTARRARAPDRTAAGRRTARMEAPTCGATTGAMLAIEPSGRALPCHMFASANARRTGSPISSRIPALDLGDIRAPAFEERFAQIPRKLGRSRLFTSRRAKHSSMRRCGDCPHIDECRICPAAIGHLGRNSDPDRIPDFYCLFNGVALDWRGRFPRQPGLAELLDRIRANTDRLRGRACSRKASGSGSRSA